MRALRLSLGMFTIIPAGDPGEPDRATVRRALLLAPVVGLGIGAAAATVQFVLRLAMDLWESPDPGFVPLSALLAATLAVAAVQILTGGLHLDGMADTADGLAARGDAERTLAVMRDPAVGAAGAMAVTLLLLVDVAALALATSKGHGTQALVVAVVAGRLAMLWAARGPAARPDGLGAWVAGVLRWPAVLGVSAAWLLLPLGLALVDDDSARSVLPFTLAAIPLAVLAALAAHAPARRRIGGITGDLLGATVEVATATALIVVALAP